MLGLYGDNGKQKGNYRSCVAGALGSRAMANSFRPTSAVILEAFACLVSRQELRGDVEHWRADLPSDVVILSQITLCTCVQELRTARPISRMSDAQPPTPCIFGRTFLQRFSRQWLLCVSSTPKPSQSLAACCQVDFKWTRHPVIVTIRDNRDYIGVL